MKKIIFLLVAVVTIGNVAYASFPVTTNNTQTEVVESKADDIPVFPNTVAQVDMGLLMVCIFVGTLGIHRFMMGDVWIGILQLITLGGLYIWWISDIIRIANGTLSR